MVCAVLLQWFGGLPRSTLCAVLWGIAQCLVLVSQSQIVPVLQHGHHTITQAVYADTHGTFAYEEYDYAGSEDETDEVVVEEEEAEEGEPVVVGGYDSDEVDYEE
jgi:hypothetical protein